MRCGRTALPCLQESSHVCRVDICGRLTESEAGRDGEREADGLGEERPAPQVAVDHETWRDSAGRRYCVFLQLTRQNRLDLWDSTACSLRS